jgi:hypothetical protein
MSSIISASIDVEKIDKTKLVNGRYLNFSVIVNDVNDKFGKNVSIQLGQSKEERDAKSPKVFLGNGKVVWGQGKVEEPTTQTDSSLPF